MHTSENFQEGDAVYFFGRGPKFKKCHKKLVKDVQDYFFVPFQKRNRPENPSVLCTKAWERFPFLLSYKNIIAMSFNFEGIMPLLSGYLKIIICLVMNFPACFRNYKTMALTQVTTGNSSATLTQTPIRRMTYQNESTDWTTQIML